MTFSCYLTFPLPEIALAPVGGDICVDDHAGGSAVAICHDLPMIKIPNAAGTWTCCSFFFPGLYVGFGAPVLLDKPRFVSITRHFQPGFLLVIILPDPCPFKHSGQKTSLTSLTFGLVAKCWHWGAVRVQYFVCGMSKQGPGVVK